MPSEFIVRGQTESDLTTTLSFGAESSPGYGYRLKELFIYPSANLGAQNYELMLSVTADNTAENPQNPSFNNDGLIGTAYLTGRSTDTHMQQSPGLVVINDLFIITQDLIVKALDAHAGSPMACNWQMKFEKVKLTDSAEAVANYRQYTIYNTSQ
jgi:hypothetical protein